MYKRQPGHRGSPRVRDLNLQTIHVRSVTAYVTTNGRRRCNPLPVVASPFSITVDTRCLRATTGKLCDFKSTGLASFGHRPANVNSLFSSTRVDTHARTHMHAKTGAASIRKHPPLRSTVRVSRSERKPRTRGSAFFPAPSSSSIFIQRPTRADDRSVIPFFFHLV